MIDGYEDVPALNEDALLKAVAHQPVSVAIEANSHDFQFYSEVTHRKTLINLLNPKLYLFIR